ncbi:MAG: hypothetical protein HYS13_22440 [Planctomycetia bacterium]|nr:hypothetical protein [Planctomycetia bacterium]
MSLSGVTSQDVAVTYYTADDSAVAPDDYDASGIEQVIIPAGSTSATINISIVNDLSVEGVESFRVHLVSAQGALVDDGTAIADIMDNDDPDAPMLLVDVLDTTVFEDGGTAVFYATLEGGVSEQDILITYATRDDSAVAPSDYGGTSFAQVVLPAGASSVPIQVPIVDDGDAEPDEWFRLEVIDVAGALIGRGVAFCQIVVNDGTATGPRVSIDDVTVDESAGAATFTITLEGGPLQQDVTVNYTTKERDADPATGQRFSGTARSNKDFQSAAGQAVIPAGQNSVQIPVTIIDDLTFEPTEVYFVEIAGVTGAGIADGSGLGTIYDNDSPPTVSLNVGANQRDVAEGRVAKYYVHLSTASEKPVLVKFKTVPGSAATGLDYEAHDEILRFNPGQTTKEVKVKTVDDQGPELTESFTVTLSNPVNATLGTAVDAGNIYDTVVVITGDFFAVEGTEDTVALTFVYLGDQTLATPLNVYYQVDWTSTGGPAPKPVTAAASPNDIVAGDRAVLLNLPQQDYGTVQIPAGQNSATITLHAAADTPEGDLETFVVTLETTIPGTSTPAGYDVIPTPTDLKGTKPTFNGTDSATCTIVEDITLFAAYNDEATLVDPVQSPNPGIHENDVRQGQVGDCYFLAAVAALARENWQAIYDMIEDHGDHYIVKLHDTRNVYGTGWQPFSDLEEIRIDKEDLLNRGPDMANLSFDWDTSTGKWEVWNVVLEQAFAKLHEGQAAITALVLETRWLTPGAS